MKLTETLDTAKDTMTVKRVFAEPYEKDGVTVIAAAMVIGGAGGGSGTDIKGPSGDGGGFGVIALPVGAYVIKDGRVSWRPTINPHRIITVLGVVAISYLLRRPWVPVTDDKPRSPTATPGRGRRRSPR